MQTAKQLGQDEATGDEAVEFEVVMSNYQRHSDLGSILVAFQIDRWAEVNRNHALEQEYLLRLGEDLRMEVDKMESALLFANDRLKAIRLLEQVTSDASSGGGLPKALPRRKRGSEHKLA